MERGKHGHGVIADGATRRPRAQPLPVPSSPAAPPLDNIAISIYCYIVSKRSLVRAIDPTVLARAAEIIKMLGHPERLKIVEVLETGPATVSDIQDQLDLPQATVSQHLARMRGCAIVAGERDGNHVYYHLVDAKVPAVLNCIRSCDM